MKNFDVNEEAVKEWQAKLDAETDEAEADSETSAPLFCANLNILVFLPLE